MSSRSRSCGLGCDPIGKRFQKRRFVVRLDVSDEAGKRLDRDVGQRPIPEILNFSAGFCSLVSRFYGTIRNVKTGLERRFWDGSGRMFTVTNRVFTGTVASAEGIAAGGIGQR